MALKLLPNRLVGGGTLAVIDSKIFRTEPLAFGQPGKNATLDLQAFALNAQRTAVALSGLPVEAAADGERLVMWREGESDLLLNPRALKSVLAEGIVAFSLPVSCDQAPESLVHMSFFVGSPKRPAGLVATTEERPRGDPAVIDVWGEALLAFGWRVLLELAVRLAADSGRDTDGAPLVPAALIASPEGFSVTPMARHEMDRSGG